MTFIKRLTDSVWDNVGSVIHDSIRSAIYESMVVLVEHRLPANSSWDAILDFFDERITQSVGGYAHQRELVAFHFVDTYLAPNDLAYLAHFNEQVSGYWLGSKGAVLVRRPKVLARDAEGRLHNATGKCIEYHDGWGCYRWHGGWVPEKVILAPEKLKRRDFFNERNVEVRRIMQERMGSRFVPELGGRVIDSGPHGTLYDVRLPEGDPEGVARYVQVQDASTARQYFLRVPPTIQTAAEAVAWSFGLSVEDDGPAQET